MMTKEQIKSIGNFNSNNTEYSEFIIDIYIDFFEQNCKIIFANLLKMNSEVEMTLLTEIVNELINFDKKNKEWLKETIWNHYKLSVENTSYGIVNYHQFENETDANIDHFQIFNRDDCYKACQLKEIISDISFTGYRYFNLIFNCPWENEHGITIGVENGNFDCIY